MSNHSQFSLPPTYREIIRGELKAYFLDEMEQEIGDLQLDLLIDFLTKNIGVHFYNNGITDAIQAMKEKTDDLVLLLKEA